MLLLIQYFKRIKENKTYRLIAKLRIDKGILKQMRITKVKGIYIMIIKIRKILIPTILTYID